MKCVNGMATKDRCCAQQGPGPQALTTLAMFSWRKKTSKQLPLATAVTLNDFMFPQLEE